MADAPKSPTRVIGIDPGLNVTGYGIVVCRANEVELLEAGVIRMPRSHGENLPERLESLFVELRRVIEEFNPKAMCLEEVYSHADYPRTAILMGHARGVICLAARLAGIPVLSFSAKRVKQSITGNGDASKLQVQRAVQNYFSLEANTSSARCGRCSCGGPLLRQRDALRGERQKTGTEIGRRDSGLGIRGSGLETQRRTPKP